MSENTPNLDLAKPDRGEINWDSSLNSNFDILDASYGNLVASSLFNFFKGASNFAGPSGKTVTHNLNLADYIPTIISTSDGGGAIGEIWVTDIAANSFVIRNSGSGVTAFTWIILVKT